MALGNVDILTMLILLIHEHGVSFHLFVSVKFFNQSRIVAVYRSFASLVKFVPKYLIILDAIINKIVFFISFSDIWLLVYRNAIDILSMRS